MDTKFDNPFAENDEPQLAADESVEPGDSLPEEDGLDSEPVELAADEPQFASSLPIELEDGLDFGAVFLAVIRDEGESPGTRFKAIADWLEAS